MRRCEWASTEPALTYHDREWGLPVHDDAVLFEFLILEGAQAGLSWSTILKKRENFRLAYDGFDARKMAQYDERKIARLMADPGIVRNRFKVAAAVQNARRFLDVQEQLGSFDRYLWSFVDGKPICNNWRNLGEVPCRSAESDRISRDLTRRGFKFVGSTICYAYMQAVGLVNDHIVDCFRRTQV
ncbi:MAG: DNA-3-methyladenine glycosylase I [Candidatus Wallbacteria bacterium]|nr:DNA-3-methyladenine glycosylase I [Candidatus Wallbacteria bacterium]